MIWLFTQDATLKNNNTVWSTHTAPFLSQFPHLHSPVYSKGLVGEDKKNQNTTHKETTSRADHHNTAITWLLIINFFGLDYPLGLHTCPKERGRREHLPPDAEELQDVWVEVWCPGQVSLLCTPCQEQGATAELLQQWKRGNGNPSERSKRHYLTSTEIQERKYDPQWAILRDFFKENDCKYPFNLALHKELRVVKGLWLTVSRKKCSFRRLR